MQACFWIGYIENCRREPFSFHEDYRKKKRVAIKKSMLGRISWLFYVNTLPKNNKAMISISYKIA